MARSAPSGVPELPCSPEQALALYRLLFQRPAGPGQLQAALGQVRRAGCSFQGRRQEPGSTSCLPTLVRERQGCPPGLELPLVMLEMERTRWAQEKLLWDLALLTGAGLGLFWPPSTRFCGQKNQAQYAWSQHSQSGAVDIIATNGLVQSIVRSCLEPFHGTAQREGDHLASPRGQRPQECCHELPLPVGLELADPMGEGTMNSRLHLLTHTGGTSSQGHRLPEGGQNANSSSASDLGEARSDADQRLEGPSTLAETTSGCFQEPNPTAPSSLKEPENSELKDLSQREEKSQTEPIRQNSHGQTARSPQGRKLIQRAPEPSEGLSQSSLARQDASEGLSSDPGPEGAGAAPTLLETACLQGQSGQPSWGDRRGEDRQRGNSLKCQRKHAARARQVEAPKFGENTTSEAWGEAQRDAAVSGQVGGNPEDFCESLENQIPQRGETGHSEPLRRTTQLTTQESEARAKLGADVEGVFLPTPRTPTPPGLPGPPGGPPASQAQGLPAASQEGGPSRMEPDGGPGHPKASGGAWPAPGRREAARPSAAQQEAALQRLLELRGAARQRLRREREQQRLRVLERLHILGNRHRRVHPLGLPPSSAQLESQARAQQNAVGALSTRERHSPGGAGCAGPPSAGPGEPRQRAQRGDHPGGRSWAGRALWQQLDQVHQERTPRLRTLRPRNTQNFWELLSPEPEEPESSPHRQHPPSSAKK